MMGRLRTEFWLTWKFIHNLWSLLILLLQTFSNLLLLSHSFMSDSLQPHELQHVRLPCPSLSPGVCTNSCPLSQWYHPTISSSVVVPFSSCLQSFPASGGNSSAGIPSPPLALFIVMLPKAHLTSHSRMSGSRWVITPSWSSGSWRSFLYTSVYSCHLFCFY